MFQTPYIYVLIGFIALFSNVASGHASATSSAAINIHDRAAVEAAVVAAFSDVPDMVSIAECESNFRQFTDAGSVFRGGADGEMVGVFQFYEKVHDLPAAKLGFDIETLEGNIAYAQYIYKESGTSPWASCVPTPAAPTQDVTAVKITLLKQVVALLTQLLAIKMATA
jgi:hypothetical protein